MKRWMTRLMQSVRAGALAGVVCAAMVLAAARAEAADRVLLKDGTVLEGTITREEQGFIWIKVRHGTLEREQFVSPDQIDRVERDAVSTPAPEKAKPGAKPADSTPRARGAGAPRIAVITLGDQPDKEMVGVYVVAQALREAIPVLEQEQIDVVVMKIASGGGLGLEVQRLSDVIHNEYKPRFRTVAWIESAISAAAMTAHCIEELYFMEQGHYGACTGFYGASLVAVKDRPLEEMLFEMEKISARGGYDPTIMRAMQIMEPLSCTIDAAGDVRWYQDLTGDHVVNPAGRILTFNSEQALKYKFSRGTANTIDEVCKLMGYQEYELVGDEVKGIPYPICRAERQIMAFRERTHTDEKNLNIYFRSYQTAVGLARGAQDRDDRARFVGIARGWLDKLERMVKNNNNLALLVAGSMERFLEWLEEEREMLRDLLR